MLKILFHICCGPCATASMQKLQEDGFEVVGFYYNPNIHPEGEYKKRLLEAKKLAENLKIKLIVPEYNSREYFRAIEFEVGQSEEIVEGFPERALRCSKCWELRLQRTAEMAKTMGLKNYGTTLRISPYQDQDKLLRLGKAIASENGLTFYEGVLVSCFHDSIKMSKEQGMYRQKYCGCIFSREYR